MPTEFFHLTRACVKILPAALLAFGAAQADAGSYYGMGASTRAKIYTKTLQAQTIAQDVKRNRLKSSHIPGGTSVNVQSRRDGGCGNVNVASITGEDVDGDVTVISTGTVINVCK